MGYHFVNPLLAPTPFRPDAARDPAVHQRRQGPVQTGRGRGGSRPMSTRICRPMPTDPPCSGSRSTDRWSATSPGCQHTSTCMSGCRDSGACLRADLPDHRTQDASGLRALRLGNGDHTADRGDASHCDVRQPGGRRLRGDRDVHCELRHLLTSNPSPGPSWWETMGLGSHDLLLANAGYSNQGRRSVMLSKENEGLSADLSTPAGRPRRAAPCPTGRARRALRV